MMRHVIGAARSGERAQSSPSQIEISERRDPHIALSLGEVVAFGGRACTAAIARDREDPSDIRVTQADTRLFDPSAVSVWRAWAERLHGEGTGSVWHVRFFSEASDVLAIATFTLQILPSAIADPLPGSPIVFPEPPGPNEAKHEPASTRRRAQIAAAACDVIARKGFANATMREIARAAGLHVPTMYQYVTSKDEMLELVYHWIMDSVRTDVIEAADPQRSATEKLRGVISAMIHRGDQFRHRIGVLNRELKSLSPQARHRVLDEYRGLLGQIAALIEEGVAAGEFRPVHATVAANLVDAICDIWPLRPFAVGGLDHGLFLHEVLDFVTAGLRQPKT